MIVPLKPGAQLKLVVDNTRSLNRDRCDDMTADEYASLMTAFRGRLVEPHEVTGMPYSGEAPWGGPDAA